MKRLLIAAFVAAALIVTALPGAAVAKDAGKSACKMGGWADLVRQDGSAFVDQGSCVSYVANGGTPRAPEPPLDAFQELCASVGGTYYESRVIDPLAMAPFCDAPVGTPLPDVEDLHAACEEVTGSPMAAFNEDESDFGCGGPI